MPPGSGTPLGDTSQAHHETFLLHQSHGHLSLPGWLSAGAPQPYSADGDARDVLTKTPTIFTIAR